jgi:hypothetical protein
MRIGVGTRQANALAAWAASGVGSVDTNVHRTTGSADEATTASGRTVDVAHVAVGGVGALIHCRVSSNETL